MIGLLYRIWRSTRWFLGALIVIFIIGMFFWRMIDPQAYTETVQGWLNDLWEIAKFLISLFLIYIALRYLLRGATGGGNRQRGHH